MNPNFMNLPLTPLGSPCLHPFGHTATLTRLIGNLRGFAYRRRHDPRWTMDYISEGCRDVTGYDPHRFMPKASIAFAALIAPADRRQANERIQLAVRHRHRVRVDYRLTTAHGALVPLEDRLTPVFDSAGKLLAIEGVVDFARSLDPTMSPAPSDRRRQRGEAADDVIPLLATRRPTSR